MTDCKSTTTSLPEGQVLVTNMNSSYVDCTHYRQLMGKLIFLTVTRPDIAYTVNRLSSYMANPQETHLEATKHLLCYIKGTLDYGIMYKANALFTLTGYNDANWSSCPKIRQSMAAHVFMLAGGPITW